MGRGRGSVKFIFSFFLFLFWVVFFLSFYSSKKDVGEDSSIIIQFSTDMHMHYILYMYMHYILFAARKSSGGGGRPHASWCYLPAIFSIKKKILFLPIIYSESFSNAYFFFRYIYSFWIQIQKMQKKFPQYVWVKFHPPFPSFSFISAPKFELNHLPLEFIRSPSRSKISGSALV